MLSSWNLRSESVPVVAQPCNAHVRAVVGTKCRVVETSSVRSVEIIEQDRIDNLFDRDSANIFSGKEGECDAGDSRGKRVRDIHGGAITRRIMRT